MSPTAPLTAPPRLGVNIDHVATLRQARGGRDPDPIWAAVVSELGGADGITIHLREDRRHIQDRDLRVLRETVRTLLNLELSLEPSILRVALEVRPDQLTFVPENRQEITTEGGLDVLGQRERVKTAIERSHEAGLKVSLFLDPQLDQIEAARELQADAVELHTGTYAQAAAGAPRAVELVALTQAGALAKSLGLALHAGHGLTLDNVGGVARIPGMEELNIGHSLIARAVFTGLERAVREMRERIASEVAIH